MAIFFFVLFLVAVGLGVLKFITSEKFGSSALIAAAGIPFFLLALSFTTVDAGSVGVVKRFGQPIREIMPGAHLVMPLTDSVTAVAVQTRIVKPSEIAASHDLQVVHVEVTLAYHVDPAFATTVLTELNDDAESRVITPAILESIKAVTAQYEVKDLVGQRAKVRDGIEEMVKGRLLPYHIVAETTSITDFSFSKEFEAAIESKVTAEQHAEKAQNDLKRIQIEAEQQIAQAKGEAEALRAQKEQITPELLQLRTIEMMKEKWDGKLPDSIVGGNSALPMMDVLTRRGKNN